MEELTKFINEFMVKFINVYSIKITEELLDNDQNKQERLISIGNELLNRNDWINEKVEVIRSRKNSTEKTCIHKWIRGNHIPGTFCGAKTAEDSSYCKLHWRTPLKTNKTTTVKNTPKTPKKPKPLPKGIIIKEHPRLKKFWHPETRLIFEIIENKKIVIARLSKKKTILKSLREKDLDVCKCYGFLFCVKSSEELLKIENPLKIEEIFDEKIPEMNSIPIISDIPDEKQEKHIKQEKQDILEVLQEVKEK